MGTKETTNQALEHLGPLSPTEEYLLAEIKELRIKIFCTNTAMIVHLIGFHEFNPIEAKDWFENVREITLKEKGKR